VATTVFKITTIPCSDILTKVKTDVGREKSNRGLLFPIAAVWPP
jgi:hypothetical protein